MCKLEVNLYILQKKKLKEKKKETQNRCKLTEIKFTFSEDGDVATADCDFKKKKEKTGNQKKSIKSSTEVEGENGKLSSTGQLTGIEHGQSYQELKTKHRLKGKK